MFVPVRKKLSPVMAKAILLWLQQKKLDYYHKLEQEHIHLLLMQEVEQGLDDRDANRLLDVSALQEKYGR